LRSDLLKLASDLLRRPVAVLVTIRNPSFARARQGGDEYDPDRQKQPDIPQSQK
jgi:hypothetical protein